VDTTSAVLTTDSVYRSGRLSIVQRRVQFTTMTEQVSIDKAVELSEAELSSTEDITPL